MEFYKRDYSQTQRERMAREGVAMPDGSFPIRNREDLQNAIQSVGRSRNYAAAKEHIMRRARALNAEADLPMEWRNPEAKKSVWSGVIFPKR